MSKQLITHQTTHEGVDTNLLQKLKMELKNKQNEEDLYWRQRAKEDWMRYGDKNTRYFHASANQKKKANLITRITDERG
jgi:hypothetical protein